MAFVLSPQKYPTDVTKNIFAISKMRGAAFAWAEPYLTQYMDGKMDDESKKLMGSFNRFEVEFKKVFSSTDEGRTAARQIHQIRQKGSVTAYYSTFRQVSAKLDWDPRALASAFYQGLSDPVKDKLDNPSDDLHTLVDEAIDIDNRLYERKMEKAGRYGAGLRGAKTYGDPMELDAMDAGSSRPKGKPFRKNNVGEKERERRRRDRLCYNCGKSGHQAKECKSRAQELHMMNDSAGTMEQKADTIVEPLNNKESSAQKEPKEEIQVHEDKEASGKDAAKKRDASQPKHAMLSWTGCYDDSCPTHRSEKEGSGWFPQGQKEKRRNKKPTWWKDPDQEESDTEHIMMMSDEGTLQRYPSYNALVVHEAALIVETRYYGVGRSKEGIRIPMLWLNQEPEAEPEVVVLRRCRDPRCEAKAMAHSHDIMGQDHIDIGTESVAMMNAPENQDKDKETLLEETNEWDELTESSEGEDGYTEEIFNSALDDPESFRAEKYVLIKASKTTLTIVTNHWVRTPCQRKDCHHDAQHYHCVYDPKRRREFVKVLALEVCQDKQCEFAPKVHVHQGDDTGKLDIDVPPRVFQRVWEGTMSLSMMMERLGEVPATVDHRYDPEHYHKTFECEDVSCSAYFTYHQHLVNVDPACPAIQIWPHLYRAMTEAGRVCEEQECPWRDTLHVHFPKNL